MTDNCRLFYFMCTYRKIYNLYYVCTFLNSMYTLNIANLNTGYHYDATLYDKYDNTYSQ